MHLSFNEWPQQQYETTIFDDDFWEEFLIKCHQTGINMILLDVGDGVQYKSHPEICLQDAWSRERIHTEIEKCKKLGIELIPKANFSTSHCYWMKEYRKMISSKIYYDFCSDIIKELYEMFEGPRFIHLGMDEEEIINTKGTDYVVFRQGDLLMHDIKFLIDEVNKTGAKPWIWHDPLTEYTEKFTEAISPDEVVISPWWYWGYTEEDTFRLITDYEGMYKARGLKYEREAPCRVNFMTKILPLMEKGYKYVPTSSICYKDEANVEATVNHFRSGSPSEEQLPGYMIAPWMRTLPKYKDNIFRSLDLLKEAREKHYGK